MKKFSGTLGEYIIQETADGSQTLFSEFFNEACHSYSGAYEETLYNYVEGAQIKRAQETSLFNILEVGLGPGFGVEAVRIFLKENKIFSNVYMLSLEIDESLINWSLENGPLMGWRVEKKEKNSIYLSQENLTVEILLGDARKTLPNWSKRKFHAIFQDPFSPKKNPHLWSVEWFDLLKKLSMPDVILSTYSASKSIRMSLLEAGFQLHDQKGFKQKRLMTLATLNGETSNEILSSLERSPIKPIYDKDLQRTVYDSNTPH